MRMKNDNNGGYRMHPVAKLCIVLAAVFVICCVISSIFFVTQGARFVENVIFDSDNYRYVDRFTSVVGGTVGSVVNAGFWWMDSFDGDYGDKWNASDYKTLDEGGFTSTIDSADVGKLEEIRVDMVNGNITVIPSQDDSFSLEYIAQTSGSASRLHYYNFDDGILSETGKLRFEQKFGRGIFNFDLFGSFRSKFEMVVKMPKSMNVDLIIGNVNGEIDIDAGLLNRVRVNNVNGSIDLEIDDSEYLDVETVNGEIDVTLREAMIARGKISTVNGAIVCRLPEMTALGFEASVVNGDISSDSKLGSLQQEKRRSIVKRGEAGAGDISVESVNGSIDFKVWK